MTSRQLTWPTGAASTGLHVLVNGPADATTEKVGLACEQVPRLSKPFFDTSKPYALKSSKGLALDSKTKRGSSAQPD